MATPHANDYRKQMEDYIAAAKILINNPEFIRFCETPYGPPTVTNMQGIINITDRNKKNNTIRDITNIVATELPSTLTMEYNFELIRQCQYLVELFYIFNNLNPSNVTPPQNKNFVYLLNNTYDKPGDNDRFLNSMKSVIATAKRTPPEFARAWRANGGVPKTGGGLKHSKPTQTKFKKSTSKVTVNLKSYTVYLGPRGGKYIRKNNEYVLLSSIAR